jgi:hypothetical protein
MKHIGDKLGWAVVFLLGAACVGTYVHFSWGTAGAEPVRPAIENYHFGGPTCQSVSPDVFVSGVWGSSPGVVALQRAGTDGTYRTVSADAIGNINGKQYAGRGWVAVAHGDLFEIRQTMNVNDNGDYRIVAAEGSAPLMSQERPVVVLDQFSAMRPSAGFCQEVQSAK